MNGPLLEALRKLSDEAAMLGSELDSVPLPAEVALNLLRAETQRLQCQMDEAEG